MIAHDLGYRYVDEEEIAFNSLSKLFALLFSDERIVVQCPKLSAYCHIIDTAGTVVVYMIRDCADIVRSQKRIDWQGEIEELNCYFADQGPIATLKYKVWNNLQKHIMRTSFVEIEYESLRPHPLWVEYREDFEWNQTRSASKHKLF